MIVQPGWRVLRGAAFGGIGVSLALMVLVGLARPPAAVPRMDQQGLFPRIGWTPEPDLVVTVVLWSAMGVGTAAMVAGLLAVRQGWAPRTVWVMALAVVAVCLLIAAPPMGSTDPLDYATYGRMAVQGLNPHVVTPAEFKLTGDPVGVLSPPEWDGIPSVYGPLATAMQWAASKLGGESATWTVLWLKVWNGLAFLAVGVGLHRLGKGARVHLLWTLNPLLLWALVGGAHVDGVAAALVVAGLVAFSRERTLAAGLLLGAAAAVKLPYVLVGFGMVWVLRRSPSGVAIVVGAAGGVLVGAYSMVGAEAVMAVVKRGSLPSWNTPWQLVLQPGAPAPSWLAVSSVMLAAAVACIFLRLPSNGPAWLGPALAVSVAWVITTPVYYPWYEALVFPLLAIAPASRLDWLQIGRAFVGTIGALPGVVCRLGDSWLRSAVERGTLPSLVPLTLLILALLLVAGAMARRKSLGVRVEPTIASPSLGHAQRARIPLRKA
ncbi:hypothetical protein J4573_26630 [Actinomadura barringtoniae]|uniref:DUF2029 domain-containing protein n=1 Tax=Actinomadura barringtoniae TaxID=1427535 RepID=A0A939PII9_9ACTN|nr:hypothetical protein [Actinomadura barringtoniae]MBO2450708.1 hypothetical protein [Actinomadura barringtoniae]